MTSRVFTDIHGRSGGTEEIRERASRCVSELQGERASLWQA